MPDRSNSPIMEPAAAEAYKLLRTNVMFSFPDANESHIVGVTSALPGEGKSTASVNLARALAAMGRDTLLIEGDMRRPVMAKRLSLARRPGLSNVLVGMDRMAAAVQEYAAAEDGRMVGFDVLTAGNTPPNPSELLLASSTAAFMKKLKEHYDFIVLDLPPVTAVTDAVAAARLVDGMIMVVRSNYTARRALADALRQLTLAGARILGFVFVGAEGKKYQKNGYAGYRCQYAHVAGKSRPAAKGGPPWKK